MSNLFLGLNRYLNRDFRDRNYEQDMPFRSLRNFPKGNVVMEPCVNTADAYRSSAFTPNYLLKWRQRKLIVQACLENQEIPSSLSQQGWLIARLQNSPIELVKLDLALGEGSLQTWAEACRRTARPAFLRLPAAPHRPQRQKPLRWWLKRRLDWVVAALLLVVLSPVLLALLILLWLESPEPAVVRQWCVGERGRLFQCFKFRVDKDSANLTNLGKWLSKLKLDRLPLLLNVLRGEMSLVGFHPLDLASAVRLSLASRCCLNLLPGVVGIRSTQKILPVKDSKYLQQCDRYQDDYSYLQSWSLRWDLKFLVMAIPNLLLTLSAE